MAKRLKVKTNSVASIAQNKIGALFPIALGSKTKSKSVGCLPNVSGVSAWYTLECGIRVCVRYSDWKPFLWVGIPKISSNPKNKGEYFDVISQDKEANPNLAVA